MAAKRAKKHVEHDEHPDERWLITYADMITLLMVLFIVLYAISQVDLAKFEKFKDGIAKNGADTEGGGAGSLDGGNGLLDDNGNPKPEVIRAAVKALNNEKAAENAAAGERAGFETLSNDLNGKLAEAGLAATISTRIESRGLVITIVTDQVLFDPGSDQITVGGAEIVGRLSEVLRALDNDVSVEGHTDNLPIATTRFASNWELSTARATSVLRSLIEGHGIDPRRMSAAGYADTQPVGPNDTPQGRAANRRVEIVVHSKLTGPAGTTAAPVPAASDPPTNITAPSATTSDAATSDDKTAPSEGEH
jgi:chemotaxis protein MotB